jgi:transposase-like protein
MKRISRPVCVDCGSTYAFTRVYKGNYCPDCHETWTDSARTTSRDSTPRQVRPSGRRSIRRLDDSETPPTPEDSDESSTYDDE